MHKKAISSKEIKSREVRSIKTKLRTGKRSALRCLGLFFVTTPGILFSLSSHASDNLQISEVWARETPPTVTTSAVYMNIKDLTAAGDRLVGVSTDIAKKAGLHTHEQVQADGEGKETSDEMDMNPVKHDMAKPMMIKMRQVDSIEIPADGLASLAPRGLHIMLFDIEAPLKDQQSFDITLEFEKAGKIAVNVAVKKPTP